MIVVRYTFLLRPLHLSFADNIRAHGEMIATRDYLLHRGIRSKGRCQHGTGRSYIVIDYKSPADRTRVEMIMSGCARTCTLTAEVIS